MKLIEPIIIDKEEIRKKRYRDVYMECCVYNTRHHKVHRIKKREHKEKYKKDYLNHEEF